MDETILDMVTEEKDLGVIMDDQHMFYTHVSAAISKASRSWIY